MQPILVPIMLKIDINYSKLIFKKLQINFPLFIPFSYLLNNHYIIITTKKERKSETPNADYFGTTQLSKKSL